MNVRGGGVQTVSLSMRLLSFFSEYGSELMNQSVSAQHLDRLSKQLLFNGPVRNIHSHNASSQGALEYCSSPNADSVKECNFLFSQ